MAYEHTNGKGVKYYLHKSEVTLRGGKPQTIYFFITHVAGVSIVNLFYPHPFWVVLAKYPILQLPFLCFELAEPVV